MTFSLTSVRLTKKGSAADRVAQMTTNEQGAAESPNLFPANYIVMEHANPLGYVDELLSERITMGMDAQAAPE